MKVKEYFNYDNPKFSALRDPMRDVVAAYQNGARWLDTVQEKVYIETGLMHTSRKIHDLAHEMPKLFDVFGDMLHEQHLEIEYPATSELAEEIKTPDKAFETVIAVLDEINDALERFHRVTDVETFRAMALKTEELMLINSGMRTQVLAMWNMWEMENSHTSFDSWVQKLPAWNA